MSRVKLKIPTEKPLFTAIINVRIGDINYGGHAGNDAILSIMHEARMQMLNSHGFSEMNAGGTSLIMADVMATSFRCIFMPKRSPGNHLTWSIISIL
jgi:acyl-CoA thioester hydrolase